MHPGLLVPALPMTLHSSTEVCVGVHAALIRGYRKKPSRRRLGCRFPQTLITDGSNVVLYQIQQLPDCHPVFVGCEFLLCFQPHPRTTWLNMANHGGSMHVGENWS